MKNKKYTISFIAVLVFAVLVGFSVNSLTSDRDVVNETTAPTNTMEQFTSTIGTLPIGDDEAILYNQSELVSNPGAGAGGADASAITTPGTLFGYGNQITASNRMADDFTIPPGETWTIDSVILFHYQTGSTTTSTMNAVNLQIWDGATPGTGSVVAGDTTTNRLGATYWSNIYRVSATALTGSTRPIMRTQANMNGAMLSSGTYWIDYAAGGTLASGPWNPPRTIPNQPVAGNAYQRVSTTWAWAPAVDGTNPQGVPFIIYGSVQGPPGVCGYNYVTQTSGTTSTLYSVSAVNDMVAWAAGVGATVRRTTDGGITWTNGNSTPGTISGDIYNIYAVDASTAFVTTSPSATFIYKTTNGGTTWTQVYTLPGGFINAIQMISPTVGYAEGDPVGGKWTILTTVDGGNTWSRMATEPVQVGAEAGWNNSFQVLGNNIWFGTNSTKVYRSTDLGVTWTSGATTGTLNTYGVHYNTPLNGVAGGNAGVVSTDGGATYSATPVPGTGNITGGISGGNDNFWVCRGSSIYRSSDNGATWIPTSVHTATGTLWDMDMMVSSGCPTGWAVGATGQIVKIEGSLVGITNSSTETPSTFLLSQNYPNPFNPVTKINFSLPINDFVTMKVYDISGKEVATLVNQSLSIGSYTVEFNASTLASGAYFYTIQAGEYREVKKMMLLK